MDNAARAELADQLNRLEQSLRSLHEAKAELIEALRIADQTAGEIEQMLDEGRRALDQQI